tara:strand:+ start:574 stop:1716 length:1143 start_codon:yes stop_codon:yes gene_type:complete
LKQIPLFKVAMNMNVLEPLKKVLESGFIGQGSKVVEFENLFSKSINHARCVSTNSATSAEHLAFHLLKKPHGDWEGMSPGDEVLATPLTCTASNFPILANGFKIKWVDVDPHTLNMDLDDLARKITPKTKAIMVVHWGGYPNDLDKIKLIQEQAYARMGIKPVVIEDCAHSFGSTYKGKPLGTHGNICTYSFQAIKHMTSVDGGMLVVPHAELERRAKLLRWYGIDREGARGDFRCEEDILEWGYKFHMNDVNATFGISNMEIVGDCLAKHQSNAKYYNKNLQNVEGVTLLENNEDRESAYWIYTIKVDNRDKFMKHMESKGIMVSRVHERNDLHSCLVESKALLPSLEGVVKTMVCIPVGWWVTEKDREFIVEAIKEGW